MAKTLTQQHAELVELHGVKVNELAAAQAEIAALKASAVDMDSRSAALAETIKKQGDEIALITGQLTSVSAERDSLLASVDPIKKECEKLKGILALTDIPTLSGAEPDKDSGARTSDVTWEEAVKMCGGYAAARVKYPDAYREMMNRKGKK